MSKLFVVPTGPDKNPLLPRRWNRELTPDEVAAYVADFDWSTATGTAVLLEDLVVVDLDGPAAQEAWSVEFGDALTPYMASTPGHGGGRHLYFRLPHAGMTDVLRTISFPVGEDGSRIDVKTGWSSIVMLPPSPHPDGGHYAWQGEPLEDTADAPLLPQGVVTWLRGHQRQAATVETLTGGVSADGWDQVPSGARNNWSTQLAGWLRGSGAAPAFIAKVLQGINNSELMSADDDGSKLSSAALRGIVQRASDWDSGNIELVDDDERLTQALVDFRDLVIPDPPEWLLKPLFVKGRLQLFDGAPGIGKGLWCAWLAYCLVMGFDPDTGEKVPTRNVIWLTAEDDPAADLVPRVIALGYDPADDTLGRIKTPGEAEFNHRLHFPQCIDQLEAYIDEHDAAMVVMDPGRSFLGPRAGQSWGDFNFNNDAHVGPGLQSLQQLAHRASCTILFVHHWRKGKDGAIEERATGSAYFNQAVRHRATVVRMNEEYVIGVEKSNVSDRHYTVRSYSIDALDISARIGKPVEFIVPILEVGEPLPDYADLDAWEKDQREQGQATLLWGPEDLDTHLRSMSIHPPYRLARREKLGKEVGISYKAGRDLHAELIEGDDPNFIQITGGVLSGIWWTAGLASFATPELLSEYLKALQS